MLRALRRPDQLSLLGRSLAWSSASLAINARTSDDNYDVPEGHKNSDLRSVACHIGLNRRRDLSLREDLCLFQPGGKSTVKEIFKVGRFPDMATFQVDVIRCTCDQKHM